MPESIEQTEPFENLLAANSGRLLHIARCYACGHEAEDLLQEIHLQLWRSRHSFAGASQVNTWLYRVALNTAMLTYLYAEKEATRAQYELLHGILRWYLGPAGAGVILLFFGVRGWSSASLYYSLAVLALYVVIYVANRRAASRNIAPKIEQIDRQIHAMSRGDE